MAADEEAVAAAVGSDEAAAVGAAAAAAVTGVEGVTLGGMMGYTNAHKQMEQCEHRLSAIAMKCEQRTRPPAAAISQSVIFDILRLMLHNQLSYMSNMLHTLQCS